MGGSGMSPSFAVAYGAGAISKKKAALLFGLFVLLGAFIGGGKVVNTISSGIVPQDVIDTKVVFVILLSATLSLFIANVSRVSVSTSSVTVFSLVGVGIYYGQLYVSTLLRVFLFWLSLPILAYVFTHLIGKFVLRWSQKPWLKKHERTMRVFVVAAGCYVAFSIGTNNVANAVGPLVGSGILSKQLGFVLIAPCFGLGGLLFGRVLETVGKEIVDLGILEATVNGMVIGSLLLLSSAFGMPEPMVMLGATSVMGIGSVNSGHKFVITHQVVRKIVSLWIISPLISLTVTYLLLTLMQLR